jgi:hypothetical protein
MAKNCGKGKREGTLRKGLDRKAARGAEGRQEGSDPSHDVRRRVGVMAVNEPNVPIVKVLGYVPLSNEMLWDMGVGPARQWATDEQKARWARERHEEALQEARNLKRHAQLMSEGGLTSRIAEHHAPVDSHGTLYCEGCDSGGYDDENGAIWPCSTWELLAYVEVDE